MYFLNFHFTGLDNGAKPDMLVVAEPSSAARINLLRSGFVPGSGPGSIAGCNACCEHDAGAQKH
ncbi:hypothetical protein [Ereboglobus luteus]|uniref:Uncharacterized protein n=1 Tax=Ereboglobus luteus TaxID=1796921 RepID=A0A2U8E5Q6_9BACT|nr:hypothetical protein [Ereboglobus luteus]AWI10181.1 hypothetical protein CKA38_13755 [Ereboglobus luteus]